MKSIVKRNVRSSRTASFLRFLRIRAIRVTHGYKVSRLSIFGHQGRNSGRRVPALSFVAMTLVRIARHLLLLEIINHPVSSTTGRRLDGGSTAARRRKTNAMRSNAIQQEVHQQEVSTNLLPVEP